MDEHQHTQQINSSDVPIYTEVNLPAEGTVILLTEERNYSEGGTIQTAYQLPLSRLIPNNSVQKVSYSRFSEGAGIAVPDRSVVPAYIENFEPYNLKRAQASSQTTKARFIIVGLDSNIDDSYIIQGSGYYSFPQDHQYEVGATYYLSDTVSGGVTTTAPSTIAQPLFTVIDRKTIQITIGA